MKFSIVIPCYNEREDVRLAIESALAQDWTEKEILVVDDSTDVTREIVDGYVSRGVRVIRPAVRRGCCEARNEGLQAASGDVIVFLNSDVHPAPDLLRHLERHYAQGADCVVLRSVVSNADAAARHIQAEAEMMYSRQSDHLCWSEAFSCRRAAALAVGGFQGPFPIPFCRDWYFGDLLVRKGYRKVVDLSYRVPHRAPGTLKDYWRQKNRDGRFSVSFLHFIGGGTWLRLMARTIGKQVALLLMALAVFPAVGRAFRLARHSERGLSDWPVFFVFRVLYRLGTSAGEWVGLGRLLAAPPAAGSPGGTRPPVSRGTATVLSQTFHEARPR